MSSPRSFGRANGSLAAASVNRSRARRSARYGRQAGDGGLEVLELGLEHEDAMDDVLHRGGVARGRGPQHRRQRLDLPQVGLVPRDHLGEGLRAYERWLASIDSARRVREDALVESPVAHPTLVLRADVLRAVGGYRAMGWPEDYDLVLRLLEAGHEIGVVPRRLVCWRDHPRRLTHNDDAYRIERFTDAKAHFLVRGFLADTERYVLWGYGHTGRALRRALAKLGRTPTHVVELHPGRLGQTIHGAPVVPPDALASLPRTRLVASVAGIEARTLIREHLRGLGYVELHDFVCAA